MQNVIEPSGTDSVQFQTENIGLRRVYMFYFCEEITAEINKNANNSK